MKDINMSYNFCLLIAEDSEHIDSSVDPASLISRTSNTENNDGIEQYTSGNINVFLINNILYMLII